MEKPLYRVKEFCRLYSISKSTFYREVAAGRIKIRKLRRMTFITSAAAQFWLENLRFPALPLPETRKAFKKHPQNRPKSLFVGIFRMKQK